MRHVTPCRQLLFILLCFVSFVHDNAAQTASFADASPTSDAARLSAKSSASSPASSELDEVRRQLREQGAELERLRQMVTEQSKLIAEMRALQTAAPQTTPNPQLATTMNATPDDQPVASASKQKDDLKKDDIEARIGKIEAEVKRTNESIAKRFGSLSISGDIRLRYESFYGQLNALPNSDNPNILGNPLSTRQRPRLRARLALRGQVNEQFDWGLRLATGSLADVISSNQTLTDFYNRKPFALDQAFINYKPRRIPGLRLQGGKFESPWTGTEMTFDTDVQFEGINETYSRDFQKGKLKNLTFAAWQLPFLERASAFVRNANGTVNIDESNRQGRDLALYGAQIRTRLQPSPNVALAFSAANHHFSGTQFITPIQFFGSQLQLPVTVTIPATATTPAQTITSQVTISRDLLVSGNANLGISTTTNNAINRDGRLASGFNLVDLIGRLELTRSKRFPIALLFNFVTNTQTHDVVTAGDGGANVILPNNENNGYWAEAQIGRTHERGDLLFGYTLMRIEKDAVLTPFNFSDITQQSDVRVQRFAFAYTVDPRVVLSVTGFVTERSNGLRGAFALTPPGSLNRPTTRLQLDTILRF